VIDVEDRIDGAMSWEDARMSRVVDTVTTAGRWLSIRVEVGGLSEKLSTVT